MMTITSNILTSSILVLAFAAQSLSFTTFPNQQTVFLSRPYLLSVVQNKNRQISFDRDRATCTTGSSVRASSCLLPSSTKRSSNFDDFDNDSIVESALLSPNLKNLEKNAPLRKKIISESIAPWRAFRLFICATLGSGAALGGFITLAGVAASLSGARSDLDLKTESINLAIDFGAALFFALIAKFDLDKGAKLEEEVGVNLEKKAQRKQIYQAMQEREQNLANLCLSIRVSSDGQAAQAPVKAIQEGAKQHLIIVAGPKQVVRDALLGASFLKMDNFAMNNILVLPYELGSGTDTQIRPSGGFGEKPIWETRAYVAEAVGEGWEEYVTAEIADAVKQSGPDAKEKGIAIIVANNGKVIRRGVGRVPWRQIVEQLNEIKEKKDEEDFVNLLF